MVPLTLIPFDRKLIDPEQLSPDERGWIDDYHRMVEQNLKPLLEEPHQAWLTAACLPLK
jgi:Xaa-Pro aminopeptidase